MIPDVPKMFSLFTQSQCHNVTISIQDHNNSSLHLKLTQLYATETIDKIEYIFVGKNVTSETLF